MIDIFHSERSPTMKRCILAFASFSVTLAGPAHAAEPQTIDEVVAAIGEAVASIETWSTVMETTIKRDGMSLDVSGTMQGKGKQFLSELSLKLPTRAMKARIIIAVDEIQWIDMDIMGHQQIVKMTGSARQYIDGGSGGISIPGLGVSRGTSHDPTMLLEVFRVWYDLELASVESVEGTKVYVIGGSIKEGLAEQGAARGSKAFTSAMVGKIKLLIGVEDGFARSVEMRDLAGTPIRATRYQNIQLNEAIDDSVFEYAPPEGLRVINLGGRGLGGS